MILEASRITCDHRVSQSAQITSHKCYVSHITVLLYYYHTSHIMHHITLPAWVPPALKLLSFSFSRPPEPELGGGLTHPTTETCRSLEGTTVQRKGSALYASTHKAYEVQRPQKLLRLGRNISDQPRHLFSQPLSFPHGRSPHYTLSVFIYTTCKVSGLCKH